MLTNFIDRIQTVTDITRTIKGLLETTLPFVAVIGEVSNLRRPLSGHFYFTMKDDACQIKAVMFKPQQRYLDVIPADGMNVICRGRISVYDTRGEYQLIVDTIETHGAGALQIAFEELKKKLLAEGLFAEDHKKPLPFLPESIAIITSPTGAALFDFLKVAGSRFPNLPIEIMPVRVQGEGAADEISEALDILNQRGKNDVIVLCRGGGSIEDLWPFNTEKVARAIFASNIPVVTAIGHEVDFTIADFVADFRAQTPTAAATAVMPDKNILQDRLAYLAKRLAASVSVNIKNSRRQIDTLKRMLRDPTMVLDQFRLRLDHALTTLIHCNQMLSLDSRSKLSTLAGRLGQQSPHHRLIEKGLQVTGLRKKLMFLTLRLVERKKAELRRAGSVLEAVSPHAVLARGYSIVRSPVTNKVLHSAQQAGIGDGLEILLHKGRLDVTVISIKERE